MLKVVDMSNKIPGENYSKNINARFWLTSSSSYLGIGRITLLEKICEKGSISSAAKDMKMSYKKAWMIIHEINDMYDVPLVVKEQGGKHGGGSKLTSKGKEVIKNFRQLEKKLTSFLIKESNNLK